ncbi:MAG TPA: HNH endonuclease signature motif containing protein [Blastocatellia bacterium]|nr:HNH endonuclease signature motif containing protein [Blastocatellia bacterium]HMV83209.1 HNH endonuclease signature motif containing protein [Blastocatellia bacterium]HMX29744.1 HNH endonuclease signature motif containing protein [Blastocatellia bacterium]HMZ22004.1 HNH endonuclease signature motif containing protein [Blastocatellia bacterium]HNG33476.1 HNH endonuclease signature motif containing protein [Blastocatellia bacterium]
MNRYYHLVAERANYRCEYCRAPEQAFNLHFEVEHITPKSRGGAEDESNFALACAACNVFKSNFVSAPDWLTRSEAALFHPRRQAWEDHFKVNRVTGEVEGLTATGRATISCLRINSPEQLRSRRLWMALKLFP